LEYGFSGILGTRDKTYHEGSYYLEKILQEVYSFDCVQNGTSLVEILSIRYKVPKRKEKEAEKYFDGF
jgi:hypothetical protein